jgi:hypothetical protein
LEETRSFRSFLVGVVDVVEDGVIGRIGWETKLKFFLLRYFDIVVEEDGVIGRSFFVDVVEEDGVIGRSFFVDVVEEDGVIRSVGWRWQKAQIFLCVFVVDDEEDGVIGESWVGDKKGSDVVMCFVDEVGVIGRIG